MNRIRGIAWREMAQNQKEASTQTLRARFETLPEGVFQVLLNAFELGPAFVAAELRKHGNTLGAEVQAFASDSCTRSEKKLEDVLVSDSTLATRIAQFAADQVEKRRAATGGTEVTQPNE